MVLDRDPVFVLDPDRRFSKAPRASPRACHAHTEALLGWHVGVIPREIEIRPVRLDLVLDPHEGRRVIRNAEVLGHHQRDRLAAIHDFVVIEGSEGRTRRSDVVPVLRENQDVRGRFSCVKTWTTPGTSAAEASIALIRPLAIALEITTP